MVKKSAKSAKIVQEKRQQKDNPLVNLAVLSLKNWRVTLLLWVFIVGFGAVTYTSLIKREGFPPIQFPLTLVQGTYFVDDKDRVDEEVAEPLNKLFSEIPGVTKVNTTAGDNFFTALVSFDQSVVASEGTASVEAALKDTDKLPNQVTPSVVGIDPGAFLFEFDMLLSVYSVEPTEVDQLEEVAEFVAQDFLNDPLITETEVQAQLQTSQNPVSGELETRQTGFNQLGIVEDGSLDFFQSVTVGIVRDDTGVDAIQLSELAHERIENLDLSVFGDQYRVAIGADFAESINTQINSLQSNLLTGLISVAFVSFLLITWRASIITGLFMVSVVAASVLVLYVVGYTLNTITLFALVLALGLFVDDATIVVESIVANKSKKKKPVEVIREAVRKIGAASFAGTFTTVLVFLPLAFLTGILGEFIRLMPITIIISLITSLILSLTLIPLLSKFILLKETKPSWMTQHNPVSRLESYLAQKVGALPRLLKTSRSKGMIVALSMTVLSFVFVVASGSFASRLSFNIFPPSKDSDQIGLNISFPDGYTISDAEAVTKKINTTIQETIGELVVRVNYGSFDDQPNARSADALVELVSFNDRDQKSPAIIDQLQADIDSAIPDGVDVRVIQFDAGPPVSEFPLQIQIIEEDIQAASKLATLVQEHITDARLTRSNGTEAKINKTQSPSISTVDRVDGKRVMTVGGSFDADDTSGLLVTAQEYVEAKFTPEYLESLGYNQDSIGFDFGQESDNADSFSSLLYAFPIALLLMYVLLALQFRSWLQPILIFVAIPFTFLGVFAGLYLTDNALSFFVQVGLIGLIGIAVNNTILLTEYVNQEKRAGEKTIDAISNAVTKRFRPLVTTTLTTVVALLPLALSDPFWEALSFTIIFGLLSSTFLVILSFPYYYLAAEWLRMRVSKGTRQARRTAKLKA